MRKSSHNLLRVVLQNMPQYSSITNPKRHLNPLEAEARKLFPYYAGFSESFVESVLGVLDLAPESVILDQWNGSGTTTSTALKCGFNVVGSDLNPAMIIVAKAALVSVLDLKSLLPLAVSIVKKAERLKIDFDSDPLFNWFDSASSSNIRRIEESINSTLISHATYVPLNTSEGLEKLTPLSAFFYLALFRVVRRLTANFVASNPTWIKVSKSSEERKHVPKEEVFGLFIKEVEQLSVHQAISPRDRDLNLDQVQLILSDAKSLPLSGNSVDAILTSPPYCTRIDYAVATYVELAVIRVGGQHFAQLRRDLTGSSTVPKTGSEERVEWGETCLEFLDKVKTHRSKASGTYYLKSHIQYFDSLYNSVAEAARVLKHGAPFVLVVQNSYYKEVRNDVALIIEEMAHHVGLGLNYHADFVAARSMVDLNKKSKVYIKKRQTVESVLVLEKN